MQVPQSAAEALDNNLHESEVLDYKAMLPPKEMVKKIAAMANAHGGLIILGVEEVDGTAKPKKPVRGVTDPDNEERNLARQIKDQLDPNPTEIHRVDYHGKTLIEIHVARQLTEKRFCVHRER